MRLQLAIIAALTALPKLTQAEETLHAGDRIRQAPLTLEAQLAPIGSPIGVLGAGIDFAVLPQLALVAGAGAGVVSLQWSVGVRPRIPVTPSTAINFTAAYSNGSYSKIVELDFAGGGIEDNYYHGSWINADVGGEVRFGSGILLRGFFGCSVLASATSSERINQGRRLPVTDEHPVLPYFGVAVGYSFGVN